MRRAYRLSITLMSLALVMGAAASAAENPIDLPAGTELQVRLTTTLSSKGTENGDPWMAKTMDPIFAQGREVVPANSTVAGHVTYVQPPGRATGRGEMRLVAETITVPEEGTFAIVASLEKAEGEKGTKLKDQEGTVEGGGKDNKGIAKTVGEATAGGAAVGLLLHGGSGALIGAGVGLMAGLIHGVVKKHDGVLLPQGTEMTFVLNQTALAKQPPRQHPGPSAPMVINQPDR
jgi:hypothetical protein